MKNIFKQIPVMIAIGVIGFGSSLQAQAIYKLTDSKDINMKLLGTSIKQHKADLHYPLSVERFYKQEGFRLVWLLKDTVKTPAWDALLLLDCILQYGLNPADYHPLELTYDNLHLMQTDKVSNSDKANFDIVLTDAIITLINNLHYGKLNPEFSAEKIDSKDIKQFKGDKVLLNSLELNNITNAILIAQPQSEAYTNLQRHMLVLTTKYSGSNYVKAEKDIRKMAINMERLRWISTTGKMTHLTCAVQDGVIINYKDVYNRDKDLEVALYY
jgi:murein L,D-transpeptidase YcbB/YkuD